MANIELDLTLKQLLLYFSAALRPDQAQPDVFSILKQFSTGVFPKS